MAVSDLTVVVRASEQFRGLMPQVLTGVYRGVKHAMPKNGQKVWIADEGEDAVVASGRVENVDQESRTYDVRVWGASDER